MERASGKIRCVPCQKDKVTYKCDGCFQNFCYDHLGEHRQQFSQQLDEVQCQRDIFKQNLSDQLSNLPKHPLYEQISRWEEESIQKIKQTAGETRELVLKYISSHINKQEKKLQKLTEQIKELQDENDFNEINIVQLKAELKKLEEELNQSSKITIEEDLSSSSFVTKISVNNPLLLLNIPNIPVNTKWKQNAITVAGGNENGGELNQISKPWGIDVDDDQTIYIADQCNDRIVEWKKGAISGEVVAGGNGQENQNDQLHYPMNVIIDHENNSLIISDRGNQRVVRWPRRNGRSGETIISNIDCCGLALDNDGYLYASDKNKDEVRRWKIGEDNGTLVAGGNGKGDCLNQLNSPRFIFVDQDQSVYVSDYENHRVVKWVKGAKEGIIVAGGQGQGSSVTQLSHPCGIIVDQLGTLYIADADNHRVMRWVKGAGKGEVIVDTNGKRDEAYQLYWPTDLSLDRQNNLYVLSLNNQLVQKFLIDE